MDSPHPTLIVRGVGIHMTASAAPVVSARPCAFCGKPVPVRMDRCPFCREEVPVVRLSRRIGKDGRREIRRGLLYMLLAGVIYYFAGGYSAMKVPVAFNPALTQYLSPAVFLGGLAMFLYGVFLKLRS